MLTCVRSSIVGLRQAGAELDEKEKRIETNGTPPSFRACLCSRTMRCGSSRLAAAPHRRFDLDTHLPHVMYERIGYTSLLLLADPESFDAWARATAGARGKARACVSSSLFPTARNKTPQTLFSCAHLGSTLFQVLGLLKMSNDQHREIGLQTRVCALGTVLRSVSPSRP